MSSPMLEHSPFGKFSAVAYNRQMVRADDDSAEKRRALEKFIHDTKLVISQWEKAAKVGGGTIGKFLSGKTRSMNVGTYQRLLYVAAQTLDRPVELSELIGMRAEPEYKLPIKSDVRRLDSPPQILQHSDMARDVPVFGTVSGGAGGLQMGADHALDYVRRPPRFAERRGKAKDIFAVLVEEVSMLPKHGPGDLLYIDPLRHPQIGDSVVVEIKEDAHSEQRAILKRLVARSATKITLEQYNPSKTFEVKLAHIVHLYRVMTTNDLLGV